MWWVDPSQQPRTPTAAPSIPSPAGWEQNQGRWEVSWMKMPMVPQAALAGRAKQEWIHSSLQNTSVTSGQISTQIHSTALSGMLQRQRTPSQPEPVPRNGNGNGYWSRIYIPQDKWCDRVPGEMHQLSAKSEEIWYYYSPYWYPEVA